MSPFVQGLLAGYGIAIPMGAVALLIISTSMRCGLLVGCCGGAGAASADVIYATVASVAGVALAPILAPRAVPLRVAGALILMAMGISGLLRSQRALTAPEIGVYDCAPLRTYLKFLTITLANPLTVLYFAAFVIGSTSAGSLRCASYVAGVGLASLSWQTLLAGFGALLRTRLSARLRLLSALFGNLLVTGLALRLLAVALR